MTIVTIRAQAPNKLSQDSAIELAEYVSEAVRCWGGQRRPDDWLFNGLPIISVQVGKLKFKGSQL